MTIRPIPKPKKKLKLSTLRNKADRKMQETGRKVYNKCMVCSGAYSCLHHFFPKSRSSALRYDWENLIPICQGCHFAHHNGDPRIHIEVIKIKGMDWYEALEWKKNNKTVKPSKGYYEDVLKNLDKII